MKIFTRPELLLFAYSLWNLTVKGWHSISNVGLLYDFVMFDELYDRFYNAENEFNLEELTLKG